MRLVHIIFINILYIYMLRADIPIGVISKTIGSVKHFSPKTNSYIPVRDKNMPIYVNSKILTKKNSFTKIIFFDDGSTISIYPETEIIFNGLVENKSINKELEVINGIAMINSDIDIGTSIKMKTEFSEVECIKCSYWVVSEGTKLDKFILNQGKCLLYNPSMNEKIELMLDSTIISRDKQEFEVLKTPITDIKYIESIVLNADEKLVDYETENQSNIDSNILVIKLKNAANKEREIVISYKQKNNTTIE